MGKHALRGMVTAWLSLIVLQTVSTKAGSGRVATLFGDVNGLVLRALSPDVAAIPDRSAAGGGSGSGGSKAGGSKGGAFVVGQGSHAPVNFGADPTIIAPTAPYTRPAGIPTSPLFAPTTGPRTGGIGSPYAT
jgi:hypothetical protein